MSFAQIWRFVVREGCSEDFVRMNTRDWPALFGRSSEYSGTDIVHSTINPIVFLTMDYWVSRRAFDSFVAGNRHEFDALSVRHRELYISAEDIGFYRFISRLSS